MWELLRRYRLCRIRRWQRGRGSDAEQGFWGSRCSTPLRPGEPVTMALVKRRVAELLAHPPTCECGRCEAASTARERHIWQVASAWQRSTAATRRRARR
jgi:hypothetical protein